MPLVENKNFLSQIQFDIIIDTLNFPNLQYFCTSVTHPSLGQPEVDAHFRGHRGYEPGDRLDYGSLEITFKVDEDMTNYIELLNWIKRNHENDDTYRTDIIMNVRSSHGNVHKQIRYTDAFPTNISELTFDSTQEEIEYLTCNASFRYTTFDFVS